MANQTIDTDFVYIGYSESPRDNQPLIFEKNQFYSVSSKNFTEIYNTNLSFSEIRKEVLEKIILSQNIFPNQVGWITSKAMPKGKDIIYSHIIGGSVAGSLITKEMGDKIKIHNLSGLYLQKAWIKKVSDESNPDCYIGTATNIIKEIDIVAYQSKEVILKKEYLHKLQDFNALQAHNNILIFPNIISKKDYNVIKEYKGIGFKPVIFQ